MLGSVCGRCDAHLQYKSAEPGRCFVIVGASVTVFASTREKDGRVYWDLSVLGRMVWADNFADGAGEGFFKQAE